MLIDENAAAGAQEAPATRYRWTICALLFFATTINYLDRQLFANLVPFFQDDLRMGPTDLAIINVSFLLSYGIGMIFVGRFVDRVGTRKGLSVTFLVWNLASMGHALVGSIAGFTGIRALLGVGEAGNFPAAVKTVSEWFPKKERALATGWFNCGSNVGAVITPPLTVLLAATLGWRACFLILGGVGIVWLFFWQRMYRRPEDHPKVSPSELAYIRSDPPEPTEAVSYAALFRYRPLYGVSAAKFFTDAPWWFYLTWMPKFLVDEFDLSPAIMATALVAIYLFADVGAIFGGWLSSRLIKRGASVTAGRKLAMLVCALGAVPVIFVGRLVDTPTVGPIPSAWFAVAAIALAAAAHQGWSSNVYTVVSDALPRSAVAMAVGVITAFGVIGASLFQFLVGRSVALTGSYALPFLLAGTLYLVGLAAMHVILPRLEPGVPREPRNPRLTVAAVWAVGLAVVLALGLVQYLLNKPPYDSERDYFAKRAGELKAASYLAGPPAKVGWMDARWIGWRTPDGVKPELIKFDRDARPVIDPKGVATTKYEGPREQEVRAALEGGP